MNMFGFRLVKDDQVGIVTKNMFGRKMPQGQIIAANKEVGVQADILMPGLYWRMPVVYKIEKAPVTRIEQGSIGIVESIDGKPIPSGRLLADEVDCNSFQDARAFLENGGCKGPQVEVLRPGTYRINDKVFRVRIAPAVNVPTEQMGVVTAQDGIPLPSGYIVAPSPEGDSQHFQDGQKFIDSGGFRGLQLETLQPGEYYINPLLFSVTSYDVATVPPGYVAVIISSVGQELEKLIAERSEHQYQPHALPAAHRSRGNDADHEQDRTRHPERPGSAGQVQPESHRLPRRARSHQRRHHRLGVETTASGKPRCTRSAITRKTPASPSSSSSASCACHEQGRFPAGSGCPADHPHPADATRRP